MLTQNTITLRLFRYDPSVDQLPYYQVHTIPHQRNMRVLDALNYIYNELGECFAYRWFCGVKRCGECGVTVNGKSLVSCWEPAVPEMTCEPLTNFPIIRDLTVDVSDYERMIVNLVPFIQRSKHPPFPEKISHREMMAAHNLSSCIECNVCSAEVPAKGVSQKGVDWTGYTGPAAFVKFARFLLDPRDETNRESLAIRAGLREFPLFDSLNGICPQGIDIVHDALLPSKRKLFGHNDAGESAAPKSTRVFIKARGWSAFVRMTQEQLTQLIAARRLKAEMIPGLEQAYSLDEETGVSESATLEKVPKS